MAFYFGEKTGDKLMSKINLRGLSARAKQWDHPVKGLFKYANSMQKHGKNILQLPKKDREIYCVSLVGIALMDESQLDWWVNMPNQDPPDGLVMTLKEEKVGTYMGYLREVEVVEHRTEPNQIFTVIKDKMTEKSYQTDTILVCLSLTSGTYDYLELSEMLKEIDSSLKYVFVVFSGISLGALEKLTPEQISCTYTMVQLLPVFESQTFDARPHLNDFMDRYRNGQESRLIEGDTIWFATTNIKAISSTEA